MNESFPRPDTGRAHAWSAYRAALVALLAALPLAGFAPAAHAERADKDKPLNIEADNMTYDDLKQVNIFTGHVVATKGTIVIKADSATSFSIVPEKAAITAAARIAVPRLTSSHHIRARMVRGSGSLMSPSPAPDSSSVSSPASSAMIWTTTMTP